MTGKSKFYPKVEALLYKMYQMVHSISEDYPEGSAMPAEVPENIKALIEEELPNLNQAEQQQFTSLCENMCEYYKDSWWKEGWEPPENLPGYDPSEEWNGN